MTIASDLFRTITVKINDIVIDWGCSFRAMV